MFQVNDIVRLIAFKFYFFSFSTICLFNYFCEIQDPWKKTYLFFFFFFLICVWDNVFVNSWWLGFLVSLVVHQNWLQCWQRGHSGDAWWTSAVRWVFLCCRLVNFYSCSKLLTLILLITRYSHPKVLVLSVVPAVLIEHYEYRASHHWKLG